MVMGMGITLAQWAAMLLPEPMACLVGRSPFNGCRQHLVIGQNATRVTHHLVDKIDSLQPQPPTITCQTILLLPALAAVYLHLLASESIF